MQTHKLKSVKLEIKSWFLDNIVDVGIPMVNFVVIQLIIWLFIVFENLSLSTCNDDLQIKESTSIKIPNYTIVEPTSIQIEQACWDGAWSVYILFFVFTTKVLLFFMAEWSKYTSVMALK